LEALGVELGPVLARQVLYHLPSIFFCNSMSLSTILYNLFIITIVDYLSSTAKL
jgi:hypothetical protein